MNPIPNVPCPDSPDGKHHFTPDVEYDSANPPLNCEYCGTPKPPRNVVKKRNVPANHVSRPTASTTLSQRNKAAKQPSNVLLAKRVAMLKRERKMLEQFDSSLDW